MSFLLLSNIRTYPFVKPCAVLNVAYETYFMYNPEVVLLALAAAKSYNFKHKKVQK